MAGKLILLTAACLLLRQTGPSFAGSMRERRDGSSVMISARRSSERALQPPISCKVR